MNHHPTIAPASRVAASLPGATGLVAAALAASCCVLPLGLIFAGLAGAGAMMSLMRYEWLTLPLGVAGLAAAWWLYLRERRRCETRACRFVGQRATRALLAAATLVVASALLLKIFPSWTAAILQSIA